MTVSILDTPRTREQEELIKILEHVLDGVRAGKYAAAAIALVRADRVSTTHAWSGNSCAPALIGSVDTMKFQMHIEASNLAKPIPDNVS